MGMKDFIIKKEDIEIYGDDLRAIIRAFADKIGINSLEDFNDKNNLEYLLNEIKFILEHEL